VHCRVAATSQAFLFEAAQQSNRKLGFPVGGLGEIEPAEHSYVPFLPSPLEFALEKTFQAEGLWVVVIV